MYAGARLVTNGLDGLARVELFISLVVLHSNSYVSPGLGCACTYARAYTM